MLLYNEVVTRKYIILDKEPYEVLSSHVFRKQQRKPVNAVKLKNLMTGKVAEVSFHVSDKVEEAEITVRDIKYLYTNRGEYWFCEADDASVRFMLPESVLGQEIRFLRQNSVVPALIFGEKIIGIKMPIKVDLKVTEANPAVRGDTVKGGSKQVKLETGATISVPMFVKEGDVVRINTETGEYTDRVS